jgi:hypothetical protein
VQVFACAILAESRKTEIENGRLEPFSLPAIQVERTRPAAELLARIPLDDVPPSLIWAAVRETAPRC